jgi:hypothetical protein
VIPVPIRQTRWFVGRSSYRTLGARGHGRPYAIAVGGEGGCALIERFERAGVKAGKDVLPRRRKSDYSEIEIREVRPRSPHSLPEYSASAAGGHEQISSYELPRLASAAWLTGHSASPISVSALYFQAAIPLLHRPDDGMDGPSGKAKRHQHLRRARQAVLYQTPCRPLSKRKNANDVVFPSSFGGCRVSQRATPSYVIALFRMIAAGRFR